jgi:hypothetical protein
MLVMSSRVHVRGFSGCGEGPWAANSIFTGSGSFICEIRATGVTGDEWLFWGELGRIGDGGVWTPYFVNPGGPEVTLEGPAVIEKLVGDPERQTGVFLVTFTGNGEILVRSWERMLAHRPCKGVVQYDRGSGDNVIDGDGHQTGGGGT